MRLFFIVVMVIFCRVGEGEVRSKIIRRIIGEDYGERVLDMCS